MLLPILHFFQTQILRRILIAVLQYEGCGQDGLYNPAHILRRQACSKNEYLASLFIVLP